jgi:hypothetical protein
LIAKFINEFEILYGTLNLKYNLHGHLHLPDQVSDRSPLHKTSAFAGEGAFQFMKKILMEQLILQIKLLIGSI